MSNQQDREREDRKKRSLNPQGGMGKKGDHTPIPLVGASPVPPQVPKLAKQAKALLLEFHHVFSLEPNEIGCTDATKHVIELMKDEPFKERFHRIAPPLVDEVRQHIQEMLDGSAI